MNPHPPSVLFFQSIGAAVVLNFIGETACLQYLCFDLHWCSMALLPPSSLSVLHGAAAFWLLIS
jgi:hypothetical protein